MNALDIVQNRFIAPLLQKRTGPVGVELEFPLLNRARQPVSRRVADGLLAQFVQRGAVVLERTTEGTPAFVETAEGDVLSFDNSYNNFEFSMSYGPDLTAIKRRFCTLLRLAQDYLAPYGYLIAGMGSNPYRPYVTQSHVSYPVYNMVDEFLHARSGKGTHNVPDFPAYISSVQTHLDITPEELPQTATLFARLDFIRALLFANSPDHQGQGLLCSRDFYWENSAFGLLAKNTGAVDECYRTMDDIAASFLDRSMFNRQLADGSYEIFPPVSLEDYFNQGADPADIQCFLSFRNIELTARGTLEVRSDCAQPLNAAFAPPAFNLGLAANMKQAAQAADEFFAQLPCQVSNSQLRSAAVKGQLPPGMSPQQVTDFAAALLDLARDGLASRGKGEEALLSPLYRRTDLLHSPALQRQTLLQQGAGLDDVIEAFSQF